MPHPQSPGADRSNRMLHLARLLLLVLPVAVTGGAHAAEEAPPVDEGGEVRYVELQPAFVTNFGVADRGRLKYVKAAVSVRVASKEAETATRYHLPALRNAIVLLLSRQDEATVATGRGREVIRAEALAELQAILEAEEGAPFIDDVLFTNFIVQR